MQVTVGVGVFAFNSQGHFVVGERKGSHGAGMGTPLSFHSPAH